MVWLACLPRVTVQWRRFGAKDLILLKSLQALVKRETDDQPLAGLAVLPPQRCTSARKMCKFIHKPLQTLWEGE